MTQIITLVGDLGAGKTTLAKVLGMIVKAQLPDALVVSNVEMGSGIKKIEDAHKFIAQKLIYHDKTYAFVIDDEAAQAGLESRGSGSKSSALESRIITHARKAHVDLILISQLKSMIDKRAQWVEDLSILCEARFEDDNQTTNPDYFHYTIYDKTLQVLNEFELDFEDMKQYVWPGMETDDIPFFESFKTQMQSYYSITAENRTNFNDFMGIKEKPSEWQNTFLNSIVRFELYPKMAIKEEEPEPEPEKEYIRPQSHKMYEDKERHDNGDWITLPSGKKIMILDYVGKNKMNGMRQYEVEEQTPEEAAAMAMEQIS